LISKSDLSTQTDLNVNASIITTCKATGDYNIDINDYTCSKPCPLPRLSDPLLMTHNWTNTTENAEYKDVMRYFHYFIIIYRVLCIGFSKKNKNIIDAKNRFDCKNGKKFVPKVDFAIGSAANLQNFLTASCLISGWFNESIGSYTCTRDCGPPTNYSLVMKNNWDGNLTVVPYGTTYK
jgi:hypothetical protein